MPKRRSMPKVGSAVVVLVVELVVVEVVVLVVVLALMGTLGDEVSIGEDGCCSAGLYRSPSESWQKYCKYTCFGNFTLTI